MHLSASCKNFRTCLVLLLFLFASFTTVLAQVPTGAIRGVVADPTGAVIAGATVIAKNKNTGAERSVTTQADGQYQIGNLLPGEYELSVTMTGFKKHLSGVTVEVGDTSTANRSLEVGETSETVVVSGDATGLVNTSDFKVDGVITRQKIDSLPLNGRNFLTLAALEPGVRISTGSPGDANSLVNVSVGGASSALTRLTVDGGSIVDGVTGGAAQNFSIESVQEFQISSFNFDLSTGVTSVGAVNIVTRTGTNDFHGSAFAFFRDRNIAAYPVLNRTAGNPDPFFRRLQSGFSVGGPIKKDKVLFFFNLEDLNQDGVFSTVNTGYSLTGPGGTFFPLSQFDTVTASPYNQFLTNARVDYRYSTKHNFFVRYSGDMSDAFGPVIDAAPNNFIYSPSNWRRNENDAYGGQGGWTWTPRADLTNDLRFNWGYGGNKSFIPSASDCPGCLGLGGAQLRINGSNFRIGNQISAPQNRALHRYETTNNASYLTGKHLIQFGGTWEKNYGTGSWNFVDPAVVVVHNPADILRVNATIDLLANPNTPQIGPIFAPIIGPLAPALKIPLPASFTTPGATITYQDLLQLPVAGAAVGIGDGSQPPPFNSDIARRSQRFRLYGQDTWRARQGLTLKYGLSYTYETNLYNHDLQKPSLLSPLYGTTDANNRDRNNFAPSVGFAWDVKNDSKTVIRGGFSMFYDTSLFVNRLTERALVGPAGNGRVSTTGDFFSNTIVDPLRFPQATPEQRALIPVAVTLLTNAANGLPANDPNRALLFQLANFLPGILLLNPAPGTPINFQVIPTKYTANDFLNLIAQQVPQLQQQLNAVASQGGQGLDFYKSAQNPAFLIDPGAKLPYSLQFSLGVQRELPGNMLLTADFVSRNRVHSYFSADRNLFNRASSLGGSVLRPCTLAERTDPTVLCSNGPVEILDASGREQYKGLLVKVDKRFSNRYAFTGSYSFSSLKGFDYTRDLTNWFGNPGPLGNDARHIFAFNSTIDLPRGFQAGFIANFSTRSPFSVMVPGSAESDINGDGTNNDLLPGFGWNQGNRSISESDLQALVDAYNQNFAGQPAPRGGTLPTLTLPSSYGFGDLFQSYDARLSKLFKYRERLSMELIGEVFNMFNISNFTNYNGLLNDSFGQPTSKAGQSFGFGGPRAFQFAARFKF
jgi:Carboxypeptidase regulatory-like domain